MLPACKSPATITNSPMKPSTIEAMVTHVSRSCNTMRARMAPKIGVVEPKNAALAGEVVFTAYTKPNDAASSITCATIINQPEV